MKRDIEDGDLFELLEAFDEKLREDPLMAPYFTSVDMADHMPRIAAFWSTILFRTGTYRDNAFAPHQRLAGLTADHFSRWVITLESAVDERFRGTVAERMKATAHRIAYSMQLRLDIVPFAAYRR